MLPLIPVNGKRCLKMDDAAVKHTLREELAVFAKKAVDLIHSYDYILLLPQNEKQLCDKLSAAFAHKLSGRRGLVLDEEQSKELMTLYALYAFTDKLIIGSFDLPHGRKLRNLLDCGIATEDELIQDVILGVM